MYLLFVIYDIDESFSDDIFAALKCGSPPKHHPPKHLQVWNDVVIRL